MTLLRYTMVLALVVLASCSDAPQAPVSGSQSGPDHATFSKVDADIDVTDRYIVVFKRGVGNVDEVTDQLVRAHGGTVHYRYRHALQGFAATLPAQALEGIKRNPNVDYIEADQIMVKNATQLNPPSWGLDRIDQRNLPLNQRYSYTTSGAGVRVYIIDTGVRGTHNEFGGRVIQGYDFIDNDTDADDCDGHGTHVAGTVAGSTVGVAKAATIVPVRVLNCRGSGTTSGVIAGVDWVRGNRVLPAVANMSLGGGYSSALNTSVTNCVNAGVTFVVAAGNSNANACNYSPSSAAAAITVGSTTSTDTRSSFSNYGTCVDIFAPGSSITSCTMTNSSSYATWSGTSMASPHVAGVAALYLGLNPGASPSVVTNAIVNGATNGVLTGNLGTGSPNTLLYNLYPAPAPTTVPADPSNIAATAQSQSSILVTWTDNASDEDSYELHISSDGVTYGTPITLGADVTSYLHTGLAASSTRYYKVRARNVVGTSGFSGPVNETTFPATAVHVENATGSGAKRGNGWTGTLTVLVHNANNQPQAGVTVTVAWTSTGGNGSASAVTGSNGVATITSAKVSNGTPSMMMSVTGLSGTGFTYDSGSNGTSSATITKP